MLALSLAQSSIGEQQMERSDSIRFLPPQFKLFDVGSCFKVTHNLHTINMQDDGTCYGVAGDKTKAGM